VSGSRSKSWHSFLIGLTRVRRRQVDTKSKNSLYCGEGLACPFDFVEMSSKVMRQLAEISGRNEEYDGLAFPCIAEKYGSRVLT